MASSANVVSGDSDTLNNSERPKTRRSTMRTRSSSPSLSSTQAPIPEVVLTGSDSISFQESEDSNQAHGDDTDQGDGQEENMEGTISKETSRPSQDGEGAGMMNPEASDTPTIIKRPKEDAEQGSLPSPESAKRRRIPTRKAVGEGKESVTPTPPSLRSGAQYLAMDHNNDYCETCNGTGEFLCCETCPVAMHFICADPPVLTVPDGDWFCRNCLDKQRGDQEEEKSKNSKDAKVGPFDRYSKPLRHKNPTIYTLPAYIRSVFPDGKILLGLLWEDAFHNRGALYKGRTNPSTPSLQLEPRDFARNFQLGDDFDVIDG
ncbi:hypothetical protein BJ684DRAFT_16383 [Piptocephalis cylindrospora]|uniref:PHD-type domain-containing protein n=1 Tax=Piptocephalis cylindrospora TaxID=1907219 RepID=A0A4P9Y2S1_9FUNG|nr:hypothetical protein BJ684DRAFT_16383 [Piptocephalis cylindrospora]|eukprot:RKP13198.1 hypothetical protein BJ684DRAFT_16383 [Piptocephalis cylindrospora]